MEIKAIQKFIRMSPRKLRLVASLVNKLPPTKAVETLPHIGKRAAEPLAKVIQSAISNAKNKGISESDLVFKEIQINDGPRLKRGRAVGHGRWHPYQKRMSHIRVVLVSKEPEAIKKARKEIEKKTEIEKEKEKIELKSKSEPKKPKKRVKTLRKLASKITRRKGES